RSRVRVQLITVIAFHVLVACDVVVPSRARVEEGIYQFGKPASGRTGDLAGGCHHNGERRHDGELHGYASLARDLRTRSNPTRSSRASSATRLASRAASRLRRSASRSAACCSADAWLQPRRSKVAFSWARR